MFICTEMGRFEHEVLSLDVSEYARLIAYYRIKQEEERRVQRGSKIKPRLGKRPRQQTKRR